MPKPRGFSSELGLSFDRGPYRYTLAPWVWDTSNPSMPHWRLPSPIGGVDLRPLPAQALAGGAPQGRAFCTSIGSVAGDLIATVPHMSEATATAAMQSAWQSAMGYSPQGATLTDLLWDQLTTGSDPTGASGPKPLVPGVDGVLRLYVGGHSQVKSARFRFGVHPHTNRLRDLLRRDFERLWEESNGADHCRRCLDYTCKKYRIDDWREFVPARLHAHVPGRLPHATTITDDFNRADSADLGSSSGGWSWTETSHVDDWAIVSNEAKSTSTGGEHDARAETDLSSDDHYAQEVNTGTLNNFLGPAVRFAAAARTYYTCFVNVVVDNARISHVAAGTRSDLLSESHASATGDTIKAYVDGSTIKLYIAGSEVMSTTDTAVTGNTRVGMWGFGEQPFDSFEAADLAAGTTRGMPFGTRGTAFNGGRCLVGNMR